MPPSLVLVASAWESPSPGAWGSLNGSWAAGAVGVAGGFVADDDDPLAPPGSSNWGALAASGACALTRIVGLSRWRPPLTTNSAGCSLVGPPRGISAIARWRPGARRGVAATPFGRATAAGALTVLNAPTSVPSSVGRTGSYWPEGHQAHVSTAISPAAPASTSAWRGGRPPLQAHALLPTERTRRTTKKAAPATGSASANRRSTDASTPSAPWSGTAETMWSALCQDEAASFGNSRMALNAMPSRIGTITSTHAVTQRRARPVSAEGSFRFHGRRRLSVGAMCA